MQNIFIPKLFTISNMLFYPKVENILKGSHDLIPSPSPSVEIQIMGGKVCFAFTPQANFPAYNLNIP